MIMSREEIMYATLQKGIYNFLNNNIGVKEDIIELIDQVLDEIEHTLSLCKHCNCMTKTINDKCGKCGL